MQILSESALQEIAEAFEAEYERLFGPGSALKDAGIELVDYGVDAVGIVEKPEPIRHKASAPNGRQLKRQAFCLVVNRMIETPVYEGMCLAVGSAIVGPAIIEHPGTTIVLHSDQAARIDEFGNTRITLSHQN
jgi:N-methylhydantoinase A